MHESATALSAWEAFYVIVGSSGGALIGLQFVVITLIAERRDLANSGAISAFGTPTVVHFGGALFVSAIMSAPWPSLVPLSVVIGICGVSGVGYAVIVIRRARRQDNYAPVWEDWAWYAAFPGLSYATLAATAFILSINPALGLFVVGAVALTLLLIGIHNAWDTVMHIVTTRPRD